MNNVCFLKVFTKAKKCDSIPIVQLHIARGVNCLMFDNLIIVNKDREVSGTSNITLLISGAAKKQLRQLAGMTKFSQSILTELAMYEFCKKYKKAANIALQNRSKVQVTVPSEPQDYGDIVPFE